MSITLTGQDLDRLFPAYVSTDPTGKIQQIGPSLSRHTDGNLIGQPILESFVLERPMNVTSICEVLAHGTVCSLGLRTNPTIKLQGIVHQSNKHFLFLLAHVPSLESSAEGPSYRFSDFAPFDGSRGILVSAHVRNALLQDLEELAENLKREKLAAEAANMAKGEFLACMSHEIRTPLNGVLGMATLLDHTELTEKQAKMLKSLRECGLSLLEQMNNIIDVSKIESDEFEIHSEPVNLTEIATRLTDQFAIIADSKNVAFRMRLHPDLNGQRIISDPVRLMQILNNLVTNALKFTLSGEILVEVETRGVPIPDYLVVTVKDSGIGISESDLERIFEPFTQADSGATRNFGGTGLGLSICQKLCHRMGGTISAESTKGVGSIFKVELPFFGAATADVRTIRSA